MCAFFERQDTLTFWGLEERSNEGKKRSSSSCSKVNLCSVESNVGHTDAELKTAWDSSKEIRICIQVLRLRARNSGMSQESNKKEKMMNLRISKTIFILQKRTKSYSVAHTSLHHEREIKPEQKAYDENWKSHEILLAGQNHLNPAYLSIYCEKITENDFNISWIGHKQWVIF